MSRRTDKQAYDRGVNIFSPDGRIIQVEYAREAVENGAPTVGLKTDEGVVLGTLTTPTSSLATSTTKLHRVEDSVGAATTGYVPDGRKLIDELRVAVQQEQLRYGQRAEVEMVTKKVADMLQESTQVGGRRPFGASLIVGGVDETGPRLFAVEPGGTPREWNAVADGNLREKYIGFFEREYDEDMGLQESTQLAVDAFREVSEEELTVDRVGLATVPTETEEFTRVEDEEVEEYVNR